MKINALLSAAMGLLFANFILLIFILRAVNPAPSVVATHEPVPTEPRWENVRCTLDSAQMARISASFIPAAE
jgi:hypothetical protein